MKVIDTREYVSVLKQLTDDGREVSMRIAGNSMAPFLIHERDTIFFRKPEAKLKKGDMVFFKRRNGQYIMHRIHHVKPDGYYIVGDAQCMIEGPVAGEQIFAVVTKVIRKGKTIQPGGLLVGVLSSRVAAYGSASKTGDGSLYEVSF